VRFSRAILHACFSIGLIMNLPNGILPALIGAGIGALAVAVLGFTVGGWMTGGTAQTRTDTAVSEALVAAMTPVLRCTLHRPEGRRPAGRDQG
jgi:hypothetical protein